MHEGNSTSFLIYCYKYQRRSWTLLCQIYPMVETCHIVFDVKQLFVYSCTEILCIQTFQTDSSCFIELKHKKFIMGFHEVLCWHSSLFMLNFNNITKVLHAFSLLWCQSPAIFIYEARQNVHLVQFKHVLKS